MYIFFGFYFKLRYCIYINNSALEKDLSLKGVFLYLKSTYGYARRVDFIGGNRKLFENHAASIVILSD